MTSIPRTPLARDLRIVPTGRTRAARFAPVGDDAATMRRGCAQAKTHPKPHIEAGLSRMVRAVRVVVKHMGGARACCDASLAGEVRHGAHLHVIAKHIDRIGQSTGVIRDHDRAKGDLAAFMTGTNQRGPARARGTP